MKVKGLVKYLKAYPYGSDKYYDLANTLADNNYIKHTDEYHRKVMHLLDRFLILRPYHTFGLTFRANMHINKFKNVKGAKSDYDRAMHYGDTFHAPLYRRGHFYLWTLKDPRTALGDLQKAHQLDPNHQDSFYDYAIALLQTKNCKALDVFRQYIQFCDHQAQPCPANAISYIKQSLPRLRGYCE